MKRVASAAALLTARGPGGRRRRRTAGARTGARRRSSRSGSAGAPAELGRLQEGGGRVRQGAPRRDARRRRRDRRPQDRRSDPRRQRARTSSARSTRTTSASTAAPEAWIDLAPLPEASRTSARRSSRRRRMYYTQYGGKRCALPLLADTYGLYYNKALFKKAGITAPPKTISELTADAKKLTKRNPDGSIKVVGLDPFIGFYENVPERWVTAFGGKWTSMPRAHAILAEQAAWPKWLKWQKSLVDWYGYNNLVQVPGGARRRVLDVECVRGRQARDEPRRRMARRVHRGRASQPEVRHGADAGRRCQAEAVRLRLHQRHDHRHPEERASTPLRRGISSST